VVERKVGDTTKGNGGKDRSYPSAASSIYSSHHMLYGSTFRPVISACIHSRRNCLAAPSGLLVHSRLKWSSFFRSRSIAESKALQAISMVTDSFGSSTPVERYSNISEWVVFSHHPMRCPPMLMIWGKWGFIILFVIGLKIN
jgi:hypothetical protein